MFHTFKIDVLQILSPSTHKKSKERKKDIDKWSICPSVIKGDKLKRLSILISIKGRKGHGRWLWKKCPIQRKKK